MWQAAGQCLARLDLSVLRNCLDSSSSHLIVVVLVRDFCRGVISLWPNRRLIPLPVRPMGSCINSSRACYGPFHTRDSTCGHDTALPKKSPSPSNEKHDTHSSSVIVEYYRAMPTGMKAVDFELPTSVLSTLASARLSYSRPLAQIVA